MSLSSDAARRLVVALASAKAGNEVIDAINQGAAAASQDAWVIAAAIVAAHTSTTTDFAALAIGDLLVHIPAVAGNAVFESVVAAGTKPSAAVVGDLYIALRAFTKPAASAIKS